MNQNILSGMIYLMIAMAASITMASINILINALSIPESGIIQVSSMVLLSLAIGSGVLGAVHAFNGVRDTLAEGTP